MKLSINKSVIKSDLKRGKYMGAIFAVLLFLSAVLPASRAVRSIMYEKSDSFISHLGYAVSGSIFTALVFAVISTAVIFSYIQKNGSSDMAHSLPLRRETLYLSHLVSTIILSAAPVVLDMLIMLALRGIRPKDALIWAGLTLVYAVLAIGIGALSAMLTASLAASVILPFIVMLMPLFIACISDFLCERYLYGFTGSLRLERLTEIYACYDSLLRGWAFIYLALGVIFAAIGLVCYKRRALENAGGLLAFGALNPIFAESAAVCAGLLGYAYVSGFFDKTVTMWISAPFGLAALFAADMLIRRSLKPRLIIKPVAVWLALTLAVYALVGLDATGYEQRVPKVGDIEYAYINEFRGDTYGTTQYNGNASVRLAPEAINDSRLRSEEELEKLTAMHRTIVETEKAKTKGDICSASLCYKLRNGKELRRDYSFIADETLEPLYAEVMDTTPIKSERFPVLSDAAKEYTSAYVTSFGRRLETLSDERMEHIITALRTDIAAAKYSEYIGNALTTVTLNYIMPSVDDSGKPITDKEQWASTSANYLVHSAYKNTIALLTEWGLYDVKPDISQITSVLLYDQSDKTEMRNTETATDAARIRELTDYVYSRRAEIDSDGGGNFVVDFRYTDGSGWEVRLKQLP